MQIGYARVSTADQNPDIQTDALKRAGCQQVFVERASGAKGERVELVKLLGKVRSGDVIVVWKLDRLGRSLKHLVCVVSELMTKGVSLKSLQEPIDTTTSQGRLVFHIFASLAEFERDLIRERTNAGLTTARARGRKGGRPKGLSEAAKKKAMAAAALYKEAKLSANEIARNLAVSKATLYGYLRHQGVQIGSSRQAPPKSKVMKLSVYLRVENNSKFVRGKSRARDDIERLVLARYQMQKPTKDSWDYLLLVPYQTKEELDRTIHDSILREASHLADLRHCFIESDVRSLDDPEMRW